MEISAARFFFCPFPHGLSAITSAFAVSIYCASTSRRFLNERFADDTAFIMRTGQALKAAVVSFTEQLQQGFINFSASDIEYDYPDGKLRRSIYYSTV
ncbi:MULTISPECIES: hypothetical protein [unclassified Klebsiella]|uniref:hypothetical protein n=1 Tax=unclassified Klebsiella TaxID=2608929 RepID=UPI0010543851|nr:MULTISPECIES: hypothetical protein [unclassified Klebsiella]